MKEEKKEENKIVEKEAIVINEKDIVNPEEVKEEETIEVEAPKVIIEKEEETEPIEEAITSTGDPKGEITEDPKAAKETELVAVLNVYYDKVLKMDISEGKIIKEVYAEKGVKLTKKREEELLEAGVAKYKEI